MKKLKGVAFILIWAAVCIFAGVWLFWSYTDVNASKIFRDNRVCYWIAAAVVFEGLMAFYIAVHSTHRGRRDNWGKKETQKIARNRCIISVFGIGLFLSALVFLIVVAYSLSETAKMVGPVPASVLLSSVIFFCLGMTGGGGGLYLIDAAGVLENKYLSP